METIERINSVIWGEFTVMLIMLCGIYHVIKNIRHMGLPRTEGGKRGRQAVFSALAASMGTGNITGCAAAVAAGGAGAVMWMWVSALIGMFLAYAENKTGAEFAQNEKSSLRGPMLYIEKGLGSKPLAVLYAAGCLCAALAMGCVSQTGALCEAAQSRTGISPVIFSLLTAAGAAAVIFSSDKAAEGIMKAAEKLVPVMAAVYALSCIALLISVKADIAGAFELIFTQAFTPQAAVGGAAGITVKKAVSVGLRRGVFSNEAGMGSSVLIHSEADMGTPENTGRWAAAEVFLDTIVCCTLTALAVICSPCADKSDITGIFTHALGSTGGTAVTICICLFAFAAVLGWCCYGEKCLCYLTGKGSSGKLYKALYCAAAALSGIIPVTAAMGISDIINCFLMFPNLIAVTYIAIAKRKP